MNGPLDSSVPSPEKKFNYKGKNSVEIIAKSVQSFNEHRVSNEAMMTMFENELSYCLKSFSAFSIKPQNNAQYRLIINQFYGLFKKYDGHLDEVVIIEKLVDAGERLLSIKGFHMLARNRCFEEARARMEGSSFSSSMQSSLSASTSVSEVSTNDFFQSRPRKTLGNLLSVYFNLKNRIEFGVHVSDFLAITEFDYGLKSQSSMTDIRTILKKLKENVEAAFKTNIDGAVWVVAHGIYHYLEISKFAIEQTYSEEILNDLAWIRPLLLEGNLFKTKTSIQFRQKVFVSLYNLYYQLNKLQECHEIVCSELQLFIEMKVLNSKETDALQKLDQVIKNLYTILLAFKTSYGFSIPDSLLSKKITMECTIDQVPLFNWENAIRELKKDNNFSLWFKYNRKKFPSNLKMADKNLMDEAVKKIVHSLQSPLNLQDIPEIIDAHTEQSKQVNPAYVEPQMEEPEHIENVTTEPSAEKKTKGRKQLSNSKKISAKQSPVKPMVSVTIEKKQKEESEETKLKKSIINEIASTLASFESYIDKLVFLCYSIENLLPSCQKLAPLSKLEEKKLLFVLTLLDICSEILEGYYSSGQKVSDTNIFVKLGRFYYHFQRWDSLNQLFQFLKTTKYIENSIYWKELQIRVALANVCITFRNNRKVYFDAAVTTPQTSADHHFSTETYRHLAILCVLISQIMDNAEYDIFNFNLFSDLAVIIWGYIEPFFSKIKSGLEKYNRIHSSIIDLAVFVHSLFGRIPYFSSVNAITIGLEISFKLSMIFERMEQYEMAANILSVCEKNIERAREQNLGTCYGDTDGFTADLSFIPQNAFSSSIDMSNQISSLRRDFSAFHVDVFSALYRCKLKDFRQKEASHILQKQQEIFKLNHVHVELEKANLSFEDIIKSNCGNDPTRRAIFLMAIFSVDTLKTEEKRKLLEKIKDYLIQAKALEEAYLNQDPHNLAPKIIRKTGDIVAISVPAAGLESKKSFSIFCTSVEKNDADVIGSSIEHLAKHAELIILHNLKPHCSFNLYYSTSGENSTVLKSPSTPLIASLPLHIPLCWAYFSEICLSNQNFEVASFSKKILISHLVEELRDASQIVEDSRLIFFKLRENSILMSTKSYIGGFVQMIFSQADYEKAVYFNSSSAKNTITTQLLRLKICIDYLLASQCAKRSSLPKLELLSVIKAYRECIPFLEQNLYSDILVKILLQCHHVIISNGSEFENYSGEGLPEVLVPVTFHLIDQLLKNEKENNSLIAKIFQETTALINISTSSIDTKINSSWTVEFNLIGYNFKAPLLKSKKGSAHYLADHGFHGVLAVSKNISAGLQVKKVFDSFFEQLEVAMIKHKIQFPISEAAKKMGPKRALDSSTSMKDIYSIFLLSGPEGTVQELARFRKNPRYTEIISEIIRWCFEKDLYETAARLSHDLEDWVDKRNQSIIHMQELIDDSVFEKKEIVVRRKRHQLFTISQKKLDALKKEKQRAEKDAKVKYNKERSKVLPRPKSASGLSATSAQSLANEPNILALSKNSPGNTTPRSHSPGPHEIDSKKNKQKRAINRFNYFNSLPHHEREKKEKAFKVLDNVLSIQWKKSRFRRRLRAVLDFESSWRANALNIRGRSLIQLIKKDSKSGHIFESKEQSNTEQFEFRKSGALILKLFKPFDPYTNNLELFQAQNQLLIDSLQALVQSTVLAHRAQDYMKALNFSKTYWNSVRMFSQNGKLDTEFWRLTLWKGFLVVGEVLIGILQNVKIFQKKNGDHFLNHDVIDLQDLKKAKLPVKNVHELYSGVFYASWVDKYHLKQLQQIDLYFCGEFLLFTIEILNAAVLPHRVTHFAKQVQSLFDDAHGSIIAPLLKLYQEKNINEIHPNAVAGVSTAIQFRTTARYYVSLALNSVDNQVDIPKIAQSAELNYEEAIKVAIKENNMDTLGLLNMEYGDFLFTIKKNSKATAFWEKGINSLVRKEKAVQSIRALFPIDFTRSFSISDCEKFLQVTGSTFNCLLIANTLTKIARFVYTKNHDAQSDLIWVATHMIFSVLRSFTTQPSNYYEFSQASCHNLVQNCVYFNDKYLLDTLQFAESLIYLSKELISYGFACVSFPLIAFLESITSLRLDSLFFSTQVSLLKCKAFAEMGMINDSFAIIQNVARIKARSENDLSEIVFDASRKPVNSLQLQAIKSLLNLSLSEKACSIYPPHFPADYELCKLETILTIFIWSDLFEQKANLDFKEEKCEASNDASSEVLELLKAHCFKLIGAIQLAISSQGELALFDESDRQITKEWDYQIVLQAQLIKVSDLLSKVFFNRKLFHDSLQWSLSVRKYIAKFKPQQYLYQGITARLGRRFLLSNREFIAKSYIATGKYWMAFKVMDETTTLYEKWKSLYCAGASSLLKFKSLDINESDGFEQRIQIVKDQLLRIAKKLVDHPFGISLLPHIYDLLIEEMDICFPAKTGICYQDKDWKVLLDFSEKSLKYEKIYNDIYLKRGDSLIKFAKEFSTRRIRHQRLIIASESASQTNLIELSKLINDSYALNKSYCRLIWYVTATSLSQYKSDEVTVFMRSFLNDYLKHSLGSEFVNPILLQRIYITLLNLDIRSDVQAGADYLRKAFYVSLSRPFTISEPFKVEKIPIDILIDLLQSKVTPKDEEIDLFTVKESEIYRKNSFLITETSIDNVNSYIASLEKEIANSALSPLGLRYNNLLSNWRRLYEMQMADISTSSPTKRNSVASLKEQEKGQFVLIGWLNGTIHDTDQVHSSTIEYLEDLNAKFSKNESEKVEAQIFCSPRSNIIKPKSTVKYYSMVVYSRLKQNAPKSKAEKNQQVVPNDPVDASRPKSGKKRPGSSKSNQVSTAKAQQDFSSNVTPVHLNTSETNSPVSKIHEIQVIKHIPEIALELLRKITKKMIIALANYDAAEDESYKEEANELWSVILSILGKVLGGSNQIEENKPTLDSRNGMLAEKLIDVSQVSGCVEKTISSFPQRIPKELNLFDKDCEFFRWLIGTISN